MQVIFYNIFILWAASYLHRKIDWASNQAVLQVIAMLFKNVKRHGKGKSNKEMGMAPGCSWRGDCLPLLRYFNSPHLNPRKRENLNRRLYSSSPAYSSFSHFLVHNLLTMIAQLNQQWAVWHPWKESRDKFVETSLTLFWTPLLTTLLSGVKILLFLSSNSGIYKKRKKIQHL